MQQPAKNGSLHPALKRISPKQTRSNRLEDPVRLRSRLKMPGDDGLGNIAYATSQTANKDGQERTGRG